jgi:hypothetical protein
MCANPTLDLPSLALKVIYRLQDKVPGCGWMDGWMDGTQAVR